MFDTIIKTLSTKKNPIFRYILLSFVFLLLFGVLYYFYANLINSDRANVILEADDILHGNYLLRNWYSTGVSFLTTEIPFFLFSVKLFGINAHSTTFACTLLFFMCYFISSLLIKDKLRELSVMNIVLFILLCGISPIFTDLAYGHCGCFVYGFIIYFFSNKYLLSKNKLYLLPVFIFTALAVFGDILILTFVVFPILIYIFFKFLNVSANKSKNDIRPLVVLCSTLIFSVGTGFFVFYTYLRLSNIIYNEIPACFVHWIHIIFENAILLSYQIPNLFCINIFNHNLSNIFSLLSCLRLIIIFLCFYLMYLNIKKNILNQNPDFISSCFSYAIIIQIILLVMTTYTVDVFTARYIAFMPFCAAVLIMRQYNCFDALDKKQILIMFLGLTLSLGNAFNTKIYDLIDWEKRVLFYFLDNKDLHYGINNDYWGSSIVTILSDNSIKLRTIRLDENNQVIPNEWFDKKDWFYEPVEFVVLNPAIDNYSKLNEIYSPKSKNIANLGKYKVYILKEDYQNSVLLPKTEKEE